MFEYDEPIYWQNFEKFNAQFWALRLSLFRLLGYQSINLKEFLGGVKLSRGFPAGKIILPKNLKICGLRRRYPAMGNDYDGTKDDNEMDADDDEMDTDDDETNTDDDETNTDDDETNTDDDETNTDDDETNTDDDETNTDDDEMDTEDDNKDDKMDYQTKVFDRYYVKLDYPNPEDNHIIYINASGTSYHAFEFLKYCEQHSNEAEIAMDRLCVALQMKKRDANNPINQREFDDEHDKVTKAMEYTKEKNWNLEISMDTRMLIERNLHP
ncbi:protein PFC0760c [Rhizophagus clarus]|uniref:Protein PFC0760c n=1 Tax=Rhizophagus clarus TaxID=94130 RepID=A0A8H3LSV1_9GLOM|nr:protein PFC0760c [Rhizophagus clarus]